MLEWSKSRGSSYTKTYFSVFIVSYCRKNQQRVFMTEALDLLHNFTVNLVTWTYVPRTFISPLAVRLLVITSSTAQNFETNTR
jgi:hypothetical protein